MSTPAPASGTIEWSTSPVPVAYDDAVRAMEQRSRAIADGTAAEWVWLLEHPPLFTAGTSALASDLLRPDRFPVHQTGRGGRHSYHGPGQRIVYVMLDVRRRFAGDVRAYVTGLEGWIIDVLAEFQIHGFRRQGLAGVWTEPADGRAPEKIAALGVRIVRGISLHGVSINVAPDLEHYSGIVPCGVSDAGVTSLAALGSTASMQDVDAALRRQFERRFGWRVATHDETATAARNRRGDLRTSQPDMATPGSVVTEPGGNSNVSNDR
ncbi:MAG: lipoyl(octanoyl) transferase LipB [Hyphomicrobium sp.]